MITVQGILTIREINGRHGLFQVGKLVSEIGEFAIKSPLIEQYDPGNYEGRFVIKKVFAGSYNVGNRFTVEVRADLDRILLDSFDDAPPPPEFSEPDPIDEEPERKPLSTSEPAQQPISKAVPSTEIQSSEPPAEEPLTPDYERIFGVLWPLGDTVKLDPTVERSKFREQVNALGKNGLGYTFISANQTWVLKP